MAERWAVSLSTLRRHRDGGTHRAESFQEFSRLLIHKTEVPVPALGLNTYEGSVEQLGEMLARSGRAATGGFGPGVVVRVRSTTLLVGFGVVAQVVGLLVAVSVTVGSSVPSLTSTLCCGRPSSRGGRDRDPPAWRPHGGQGLQLGATHRVWGGCHFPSDAFHHPSPLRVPSGHRQVCGCHGDLPLERAVTPL
jgi:hypothetical protein